jgi:hypothetical protein
MSPEQREFLNLEKRPARLTSEQASWMLGFQAHEVSILVQAGLLVPLGKPGSNAPKFFSLAQLEACMEPRWLSKATGLIQGYWKGQNSRRPRARRARGHTDTDPLTSN